MVVFFKRIQELIFTHKGMLLPPRIPHKIPFLGLAIDFNIDPIMFLRNAYEKYGDVFSFTMVGQTFTYLIGSDASALMFNSKNDVLNAEEVYGNLTGPVVGKGVGYAVENAVFLEQKKIMKVGLSVSNFRKYVPMITKETTEYFKKWGDSGEKDLLVAMEELILLIVSRCLHGQEIRSIFNERLAKLYADLDRGLTPLAWLFPSWMPFPSFRKRDQAHREVKKIFYEIIEKRRAATVKVDDYLQTLIDSRPNYNNGNPLTDDEVAGMCMGLLVAAQHTSSTTTSWLGFFLSQNQQFQKRCYEEQLRICGSDYESQLTYDQLKDMSLLDVCLKETLRLRPPVAMMLRMVKKPLTFKGYTIPAGHQVCVCTSVNQCLQEKWAPDPFSFNPDRFLDEKAQFKNDKFSYIPFGVGHHRCVGESFAYLQIKTIWSVLLRKYEFELVDGHFPPVNFTTLIHTPLKPVIRYKLRETQISN
ncbi:lanosterol 14-alpha demethylase-like [Amphiura filiformis]|uniref:lanosterol 14-alpha demethylase-like n=1 Tax=Amphiura filiformis TaxID=82378 RepID=UPI003B21ABCA